MGEWWEPVVHAQFLDFFIGSQNSWSGKLWGLLHGSNWGQRTVNINVFSKVVGHESTGKEHLSSALGVTNVGHVIAASLVFNKINESGQVFVSHVLLVEVPVLLVFVS